MRQLYPFAPYPWVRVALSFLPGIALGRYYTDLALYWGFLLLWMIWFISHVFFQKNKTFIPEAGMLLLCCAFGLGWFCSAQWHKEAHRVKSMLHGRRVKVEILLTSFPASKDGKKWVVRGNLISISFRGQSLQTDGGVYFHADQGVENFRPGQIATTDIKIFSVSDTASGFQQYLYSSGVWFTGRGYTWALKEPSPGLYASALTLAAWAKEGLYRHIPNPLTAGLATALVTGDRGGLDKEISTQYKRIGVTHILSVSGLHVGLVCLVLLRMFAVFDQAGRKGRQFRIGMMITALSGYALITGLAPSVCRAVLMTNISLLGQAFNRKPEGENILAFACIAELVLEPCWLFYPGFQLSFAALAGLIWIQPLILSLWEPSKSWMTKIWDLSATAIAAQMSTLPFLLPIATDFPVYFLPANLIIVPLASLLTGASFILVLLSPVPFLPDILGAGIEWLTLSMNWIARLLSILPGVSLSIPLHEVWQAWILGIGILLVVYYFHAIRNAKS
jgi:competence protein ComEC